MQGSFARRLVMWLVVTLCVAAGFAIWVVLTGSPDATACQGLSSALVAGVCVITGLAGATVLERDDGRRSVGLVTILLSGFELALALAAIWGLGSEAVGRALGACSSLLAASVHASLMLGRVRGDDGRATRSLTAVAVAFSTLGAAVLAGGFAFATGSPGSGYWRSLGVLAVLGTLFTLLALIARRLDGRRVSSPGAGEPLGSQPPAPPTEPADRIRRALVVHPARAARAAYREPAAD